MPDENEGLAPATAENAEPANVEQAEQVEADAAPDDGAELEATQPDAPEAKPTAPDYKKQYEELQKLQSRQANELGMTRREIERMKQDLERFKPKEEKPDPVKEDPWFRNLKPEQQETFNRMFELFGKRYGLDKVQTLEQRLNQQERDRHKQELSTEVQQLRAEVGEEAYQKYLPAIQQEYEALAANLGVDYYPPIGLKKVWNIVTAEDRNKSLADRAKQNRDARAQRVALADTGKTSPKPRTPTGFDRKALEGMSEKEAWRALLSDETTKAG